MRQTLKIFVTGLTLLTVACAGEPASIPAGQQQGDVPLRIVPTIEQAFPGDITAGDPETASRANNPAAGDTRTDNTRAKVEGGTFSAGTTIGLGLSAPMAEGGPISPFYRNFNAQFTGGIWRYLLDGINVGDRLSGFSNWNDIELYGYYPYSASATDLSHIPFRIASPTGVTGEAAGSEITAWNDYMIAGTVGKNMAAVPSQPELSLHFKHLMTAVDLIISRSTTNHVPLKLGSATFEIVSGARSFITEGTIDAVNPNMSDVGSNITPLQTAAKLTISYPGATSIEYIYSPALPPKRLLVIMPQLSAADGDAKIKITIHLVDADDQRHQMEDLPAGVDPSVEFLLSSVDNGTGNPKGLLAGYSYAVTASIGTYTHFAAPSAGSPTPPHINNPALTDENVEDHIEL